MLTLFIKIYKIEEDVNFIVQCGFLYEIRRFGCFAARLTMTKENDLIARSIDLLQEYCKRNPNSYFEQITDNTIFIGPRAHQILRGKQQILAAWTETYLLIDFSVSDITAYAIPIGSRSWEVLLLYRVQVRIPNQPETEHWQRAQITWVQKDQRNAEGQVSHVFRIAVMHLSNPAPTDERDKIYNVVGNIPEAQQLYNMDMPKLSSPIAIRGVDGNLYNYLSSSVLWIESDNGGHRSIVHTRDQDITCLDRLAHFEQTYPDCFIRAHISYLINPVHVKSIRRFEVTLWDGTTLPIPEKKYTAFKKTFLDAQKQYNSN